MLIEVSSLTYMWMCVRLCIEDLFFFGVYSEKQIWKKNVLNVRVFERVEFAPSRKKKNAVQ